MNSIPANIQYWFIDLQLISEYEKKNKAVKFTKRLSRFGIFVPLKSLGRCLTFYSTNINRKIDVFKTECCQKIYENN